MALYLPPTTTRLNDWLRNAALVVNTLLHRPFQPSDTPPPNPAPGDAYFDTTDGKAKCWDGATWQPLW